MFFFLPRVDVSKETYFKGHYVNNTKKYNSKKLRMYSLVYIVQRNITIGNYMLDLGIRQTNVLQFMSNYMLTSRMMP